MSPSRHKGGGRAEQQNKSKPVLQGGESTEKLRGSMAAGGGVVKHILLVRFKEEVTPERLDQLIRGYAALVDAVPSMKAFHW